MLTSCVLLLIAFTAGGVLSITDIVIAGDTLAPLSIDVIFIVSFCVICCFVFILAFNAFF
ncbi:hypothetical protein ABXK36_36920 [Bacillus cereus]|uniref:hypothetical protein n=1 Tax=Bacillus cereus TaxID=1396 RepID=UPI0035FC1D73